MPRYRIEFTSYTPYRIAYDFLEARKIPHTYQIGRASEGPARTSEQYLVDSTEEQMSELWGILEANPILGWLETGGATRYCKIEKLD